MAQEESNDGHEAVDSLDKLPLHEDIMQLARLGEIGPIQKLVEDGKYDIKYKDEQGITPLHVHTLINNTQRKHGLNLI